MTLSPELQAFIAARIDSVGALEVFLLLVALAEPLSADDVSERVGLPLDQATAVLDAFTVSGLVARDAGGRYRTNPASEPERAVWAELGHEYAAHRIDVINAVYSAGLERLRAFTDAFKLRKP